MDDLRDFLAKQFHRTLELCPDKLMIGSENVDIDLCTGSMIYLPLVSSGSVAPNPLP